MIKKFNIFGYRIDLVFRHRFEKPKEERRSFENYYMWKEKRLGLWYKTFETVSKPKNGPAKIGQGGTTSTSYLFGVDLIICKFWIDICYRPFTLEI